MDPVSGQIILQVPVLVTQVPVHINIKNISAVGQGRDRLVALHDGSVIENRVLLALILRDMHDPLNIDNRFRLHFVDLSDHLAELFVVVLSIRYAQCPAH